MAQVIVQNESVVSPPEPDIIIRTMTSDIAALKQSGGQVTEGIIISGDAGERIKNTEAAFKAPASIPKQDKADAGPSGLKPLFIIAAVILGIVVLFSLGYFIIFPWLFSK